MAGLGEARCGAGVDLQEGEGVPQLPHNCYVPKVILVKTKKVAEH